MRDKYRYGNLVRVKSSGEEIIIHSLNSEGVNLYVDTGIITPKYKYEYLEGVPITDEWILKFYNPHLDRTFFTFEVTLYTSGRKTYLLNVAYKRQEKVEFIHELQNIYFDINNTLLQ